MFSIERNAVRWGLAITAIVLVLGTLAYSNHLANKLAFSERNNTLLWGKSIQTIAYPVPIKDTLEIEINRILVQEYQNFILDNILQDTSSEVPRILVDWDGKYTEKNVHFKPGISEEEKKAQVFKMIKSMDALTLEMPNNQFIKVYYGESSTLQQLRFYPIIQILVALLFISIVLIVFNVARKEEQNRIWAGLAKETAHQLGTPVSSLLAWVEYLKLTNEETEDEGAREAILEMEHDIQRLMNITQRFSRIGSRPDLLPSNLGNLLEKATDYMRKRMSKQVECNLQMRIPKDMTIPVNDQLFEWVIENVLKNALDAMEGKEGKINIEAHLNDKYCIIDISDTGKGMPKSMFTQVFQPGFTTKKRGWGLGLSLSKRIMEMYHNGKIFVKESEIGKGTTFRIMLKKA
ncbi:MAG: HAMP domain-containing histidine kinase [Bacteroidia bacterium]|nr:HAMP domain-containing histidine kinase [Bacteroidia bacterium]